MSAEALRALAPAAGVRVEEEALAIDGLEIALRLRPRSGEELAALLRAASDAGGALLVRGGGSRLGVGNPLRRADAVLETGGVSGVVELDADEGVAQVRAGTPLAGLAGAAREAGWELPLDAPGAGATVGGVIAAAAVGARHVQPRDVVLGLGVVLASGARTRIGGRVVKNVTGYDLGKLHTGAFGGLGVIEWAWLRLSPLPEVCQRFAAGLALDDAGAGALALLAARRPAVRAAVWQGAELRVEVAGDAAAVASDASWLEQQLAATPLAPDAPLERSVPEAPGAGAGDAGAAREALAVRIAARVTRAAAAASALRTAGARVSAHPGRGLVHGRFAPGADEAATREALRACAAAAREAGGTLRIEAGPLPVRRDRDVFGESEGAARLVRALKERFDPGGVLNPGRLPGRV